jgi:hypothetical protein
MPLADELSSRIGFAQESLRKVRRSPGTEAIGREKPLVDGKVDFTIRINRIKNSLEQYRSHLDTDLPQFGQLGDRSRDRQTLSELAVSVERLEKTKDEADWLLDDTSALRPNAQPFLGSSRPVPDLDQHLLVHRH